MEDTPLHLAPVNTTLFDYDSDYDYETDYVYETDYDINDYDKESSLDYQDFEPIFIHESLTFNLSDINPDLEERE